jgi:hypothetical protein
VPRPPAKITAFINPPQNGASQVEIDFFHANMKTPLVR